MLKDHRSYRRNFCSCERKAWKNSCLYWITAMIFFTCNSSSRSSNICFSYIHYFIFIIHRFITNRLNDQLPVGLLAQLVSQSAAPVSQRSRVQIQYKPKFFRLSFRNCKSCVYNCDDSLHLINFYCWDKIEKIPRAWCYYNKNCRKLICHTYVTYN